MTTTKTNGTNARAKGGAVERARGDVIAAAERLWRAARRAKQVDHETYALVATLISELVLSFEHGSTRPAELRKWILRVASWPSWEAERRAYLAKLRQPRWRDGRPTRGGRRSPLRRGRPAAT